jgi:hypothetical protein
MKNLLLSIFVFFTSFVISQSCTHTLHMTDTYGDGWNGNRASVSVNGATVVSNVTFNNGFGPVSVNFNAPAGATIRVWRSVTGNFSYECQIRVTNNTGATVIPQQTLLTGSPTIGGSIGTAQCGGGGGGCVGNCTNNSAYGFANAPASPGILTISYCTYQSEYNTVYNVVAGRQYRSTYNLGGWITVRHTSFSGTVVATGPSPLTWTASVSGTYYIHYNTNNCCGTTYLCGTSTIECLTCAAAPAPVNDLVCNATGISCGQTLAGTTVNATNSGTGEAGTCGISQTQPGVWYVVVGNGQNMSASLCGTAWDSKISVLSGPNCSSLTCVGGNDDNGPVCGGLSASYSWASTVGVNYYILVHGYSSTSAFQLSLTCSQPPPPNPSSISATSNTICVGQNVTLTVNGASGTVYWFTGGCGVGQIATGNSVSVTPSSTTTYYARNFNGSMFSSGCVSTTITVNPVPSISINPVTNTICENSSTQLITTVSGLPAGSTPTYSWSPSIGLTNPSAPSPYASPPTTQVYSLTVYFNGCSNSLSTTITVNQSVGFVSTISGNNNIIAGTQETYSITPVANATYQWAFTESITAPLWLNIPNSNSPSISFHWPQTTTDGSVRVTVSNANNCGTQVRFFNIITNGALPIELLSFDGTCNDNVITLNWRTASEHNSQYFEIQKSRDGENWSSLTTVESAGNSTQELSYEIKDHKAIDGNNYYKLIQYDIDGQFKEYGPINVICNGNSKGYFSIFPNPSTGDFQVILNNKRLIGDGTLEVRDSKGSVVYTQEVKINQGINLIDVSNINLTSGIYYVSLITDNNSTETLKQVIR